MFRAIALAAVVSLAACSTAQKPSAERVAERVAQDFLEMGKEQEFGAFISCDETKCWSSEYAIGDESSVSGEENNRIFPFDRPDDVVGYIHSHPRTKTGFAVYVRLVNRLNERPSSQDYFANAYYASQGDVYQDYTLWIVGPDTVLRAYPLPK